MIYNIKKVFHFILHFAIFFNLFFISYFFFLAVKPTFNKEPSDANVLAGQTVQFYCAVEGDPQPKVLWRKDDGIMPVGR